MKDRQFVRREMIQAVGVEKLMRKFSVAESTVYKWGQPLGENGHRAPEEVTDFFLTDPRTTSFRREYLSTFAAPAGFLPVSAEALEKTEMQILNQLKGLVSGNGIYNSDLPTECSACGAILIFVPVDGRPRPFCVRCKK